MQEIWKDIPGWEWQYQVSSIGRVKSFKKWNGNILSNCSDGNWYLIIKLCKDGKCKHMKIHRLVAITFLTNTENKMTVNHKNGIRDDNNIDNLEWATYSENSLHAFRELGRQPFLLWKKWPLHPSFWRRWLLSKSSKPVCQLDINRILIKEFISATEASNLTWIERRNITACCRWKVKSAWWFAWSYKSI